MAEISVVHDTEHARYVGMVGDEAIGQVTYHDTEEGRVFTHSEILPEHQHQGYGTSLVRGALDDTRAARIRPIGRCSMVRNFLAEHPDYSRV